MAIGVRESVGVDRPGGVRGHPRQRPAWMSQHVGTAFVGAVVGYLVGHWAGNQIASNYAVVTNFGTNDIAIFMALILGVVGWLVGIGAFNYPLTKIIGREPAVERPVAGWERYLKFTLDHKVVGIQYTVGVLLFFFTGGLLAMGIRTELLTPTTHFFNPGTYIQIVGEHGTIMMMMASSLVVGPLGNFFVPLMIGAKRMALPRVEAFSFWIFISGLMVILAALPLGGFPTGWTGYAPLQTEAKAGMDAYLVGFGVIAVGMILAGFNMLVTIVNYRAPGCRWSRMNMFCWSMIATSALLTLATPVLFVSCFLGGLDRTVQTAFFVNTHGGSSYLWENLFWFFGHPEVYIMALPGFGIVGEILTTFTRKPLFAYRVSAAALLGVALLSFFVWQHHIFQSGINPDMRPLYMLTTELISIPTGFVYLVGMGTLWRARIRFTVPMLFALAVYFNFLIGGMTGVFLSDVPVNVTVHGSFFVMAHFHYTIMGGLVFAFFGGLYYWMPKMTGYMMNDLLAKIHFWMMFVFFNSTFFPLFILGFLGMPRRVFEYAPFMTNLNDWASISAFLLGSSFLVFVANFVWSTFISPVPAPANPWDARGLEWMTATPVPFDNWERIPVVLSDPYTYGEENALPIADLGLPVAAATAGGTTVPAGTPTGAPPGSGYGHGPHPAPASGSDEGPDGEES
ncbi:MAG: cytochrome c oxidase subunit I [Acidimicrobiales bacterium]